MQSLDIALRMNAKNDWSVEVDGLRRDHVSLSAVQFFVQWVLAVAKTAHIERNSTTANIRCFVRTVTPTPNIPGHEQVI
jgi:hypothetical protein